MTEGSFKKISPSWTRMVEPCLRGHIGWRNKHMQCVECNRVTCSKYAATDVAKIKAIKWQSDYRSRPGAKEIQRAGNARRYATQEGRDKYRNSQLKRYYGISLDDYDKMSVSQGGKCAICGSSDAGGQGRFHVDHCHKSDIVRGLLCASCNLGIGNMKDAPSILIAASNYILRHREKTN